MMQILRWSAGRVMSALITLLGVSVLIFVAIRLMPGSYEDIILGPLASAEERQLLAEAMGYIDLSAPVAMIVSGGLYYLFTRRGHTFGDAR